MTCYTVCIILCNLGEMAIPVGVPQIKHGKTKTEVLFSNTLPLFSPRFLLRDMQFPSFVESLMHRFIVHPWFLPTYTMLLIYDLLIFI